MEWQSDIFFNDIGFGDMVKQKDILDIVWNEWKHVSRVRDIPSFGGAWGGFYTTTLSLGRGAGGEARAWGGSTKKTISLLERSSEMVFLIG